MLPDMSLMQHLILELVEQPSDLDQFNIQQTKTKLCQFWATKSKAFNMGLGVYASGQIHIDSQGFRA